MNQEMIKEPILIGKLDIRAAGPRCKMRRRLNGDGRMEMRADNRQDVRYIPHQVQCLTALI